MPPARLRKPFAVRGRVPPPPTLDVEPTLQLAIAKEGIGLELSAPVDLGAARLVVARTRLLGLRFPLDVSGGVERFRHRRTALEQATIDVELARAERWLSSLASDLLAPGAGDVRMATIDHAADLDGLRGRRGDLRIDLCSLGDEDDDGVLSFDVTFTASGAGLVAYAHRARAVGVEGAAIALIGRFFQRIASALGGRARGTRLDVSDPARVALVQAFVPRGARVPMRDAVVLSALSPTVEGWTMTLERDRPPKAPRAVATMLAELDRAVGAADAALIEGDPHRARELYLRALEKAPRHKAILSRLAELDAATDDRAEAALAWLREAHRTRGTSSRDQDDNELGRALLGASLHARLRAFGRARAAWKNAGDHAFEDGEARLASRAWALAAATCADDEPELGALLDRALAADPSEPTARWRRARVRIAAKDDERAMEDVQHLEAIARGTSSRRRTLLRAASLWADAGRNDRAVPAYERALRQVPDDRDAIAGLGRALLDAGEIGRGVALLSRAATLDGDDDVRAEIVVTLARALADRVGDVPAAIARLREIPADSSRAATARALEASYRGKLGDAVGATRAWSDALDVVEHRNVPLVDAGSVRDLFLSASHDDAHDRPFALRFALAALSVAPHDAEVRARVKALGHVAAEPDAESRREPPAREEDLDARAERLLAKVKAEPNDDRAVDELVDVLTELGRDFELFALLAARFEDASPDERRRMLPKQRVVLERMASAAEAGGRTAEASLYRDAVRALG